MRACTAFVAILGVSALAVATAQAAPTRSIPTKAGKSSKASDRASSAVRKSASPSFVVDLRAGAPVDLGVRNVRPAGRAVGFAEAPAAKSARDADPAFALSPAGAYGDAGLLDANRYYEGR